MGLEPGEYLVVYDHSSGSELWAVVIADSPNQIRDRYGEVRIPSLWPSWMTDRAVERIRAGERHDVLDEPAGVLAAIIADRREPVAFCDRDVLAAAGARSAGWAPIAWDNLHLLYPVSPPHRQAVVVPLPSSPELKPWLYLEPLDADDYLQQLDTFVREEMDTGASAWAEQLEERDHRLFVLTPYGFKRKDAAEHERLLAAILPSEAADFRTSC